MRVTHILCSHNIVYNLQFLVIVFYFLLASPTFLKKKKKNFFMLYIIYTYSEERCVCVWLLNVDGCIWIGRGGEEGGGREHE